MFQLRLEPNHVPECAQCVVLPELDYGVRTIFAARIFQPHRLHRTEAQGVETALGHHLDRQTSFEIGR